MNKNYSFNLKILLISLVIPILFFTISILTMNDYGETTDEKFDQHIGEFYYNNWAKKGVKGLEERFIPLQRNYGPFFDVIVVAANDLLNKKSNLIKNPVASFHFPVIIISALAIWVVFIFSYLNWGLTPAFLSSLTLAIMPRFIGDSQNNLKDTPLMTFFSISLLLFYLAQSRNKLIFYLLGGVFLGLTYSIKPNALIILLIIGSWYLLTGVFLKKFLRFSILNSLSLIIALLTILIVWPYYQYQTFQRFIETYLTFKNHVWDEYILYLGQFYRGGEVPWHYPLVMFGVTTPSFFLVLILLGVLLSLFFIFRNHKYKSPLLLLLLWMIFPPATQVASGAPMYDGIRHFLVVLPPMTILVGFTIWQIGIFMQKNISKKYPFSRFIYIGLIFLAYLQILLTNIRLHPYQIVYFNQFTGGLKGAYSRFDLDYWGQSQKEAAEWINRNLPSGSKIYTPLHMEHHFPIDLNRFSFDYEGDDADYKVVVIRGMLKNWDTEEDYLNPKKKSIYSIKVEGVDILRIFKLKEK
ncbi:hypothetical protein A2859_01235 [Candidatus Roizmanbacteria bacterium RIFCSPHIGHO2_01_FULL_37_16b]|nr:MAG: hypothetical protein A2859_01235 [Candidatus Roizmanbacteria bacterium RIFCSPHIGHO2_01_FULL_37_16b]OGK33090.1 MAG: hypothetical protein A3F57_05970 [Candidatus Roizmanbacteria bacterium RIFCSPHIGHO2_12_FULL_36_11]